MRRFGTLAAALLVSACAVGPDYDSAPVSAVPAGFKEAQNGVWKPGRPADTIDRGAWWSVYQDPVLDALERQVVVSNQTLRQSEAAYREQIAVLDQARASFFPSLSADGSVRRSHSGGGDRSGTSSFTSVPTSTGTGTSTGTSTGTGTGVSTGTGGASTGSAGTSILTSTGARTYTQYSASLSANWTIDVWGRIRRTVESDAATAQATAADLASATLSQQATLAANYFQLRARDEQRRLYEEAVRAYEATLRITQNQYKVGTAARADVAQAETQLQNARSQLIAVGVQRATLEHAIAVAIGKPPSALSIVPAPFRTTVPVAPAEMPSRLLERRPDIAAAERRVAAANAEIGVAVAAYYPELTLSGSYSFASTMLDTLFRASNATWAVGPALSETLIDFGAREAQVEQARARFDQAVAQYRLAVLQAFQQTEDELASLTLLERQAEVQAGAVRSAQEAERLVLNQYKAGTVAFTSVVTAQTTALNDEQTAVTILSDRLTASVTLIQALGGGWGVDALPDRDTVETDYQADKPTVALPPQPEPNADPVVLPR